MRNRLLSLAIGALSLSAVAMHAQAEVTVRTVDGGWQVKASNEPLTGVLDAIAKRAGIKVSGTAKLIDDPVMTGVYQGSLQSILQRLLRDSDYAFETAATAQGGNRITRLVVLSGTKGKAAPRRAVKTARRLPPAQQKAHPLTAEEKRQGERVNALLAQRARVGAGLQNPETTDNSNKTGAGGSGITRNPDGSFDISPEAQARMAEATRKAQQDLQALVAAIRRNEQNRNGGDN